MNFNISTINKFFTIIVLISHMYILSMLNPYQEATAHNQHNELLSLPSETLRLLFSFSIDTTNKTQPLENIIEPTLSLSTVCKKLTPLLFPQVIRIICQAYTIEEKNTAMKNFLHKMPIDYPGYWNKRNTAFFLMHAGAKNNAVPAYSLLANAVYHKDKQMMKVLFKNNTDPNQVCPLLESPIFFRIPTLDDLIQIFIEYKVDLNATGAKDSAPNVLWKCIMDEHDLKLVKFYIDHKVNVALKDDKNNCLLHLLISRVKYLPDTKNPIELATLFLNATPEIINIINEDEMTPLDYAYNTLNFFAEQVNQKKLTTHTKSPGPYKIYQLTKLFKKYGGKTAQELQKT